MIKKFLTFTLFLLLILGGNLFSASVDKEIERNTVLVFYTWEYTDIFGIEHKESTRGNGVFTSHVNVVTCAHLFWGKPSGEIYVHYFPGNMRIVTKAKIIKFEVKWDLALLEVEIPMTWKPIELANAVPKFGERIYFSGKSSMDSPETRVWYYAENHRGIMVFPIYYGDSGGGVYDEDGKMIGLTYQIILVNKDGSRFPTYIGYGVPLHILRMFLS